MALFCTDTFRDANIDRLAAVAPDLEVVALRRGEEVSAADIERITIAFFSDDAWPERAAPFMKVALEATNLQWLHSMSAGRRQPDLLDVHGSGGSGDHVVGGERGADRGHGDAVSPGAEPRLAPVDAGAGSPRVEPGTVP